MSRAYVSEDTIARASIRMPERPISDRPNLVTRGGCRLIVVRLAELHRALGGLTPEDDRRGALERDLRYWQARHATAQPVDPPGTRPDTVRFGTRVTLRARDGRVRTWHLVGEDEADPASGRLNWSAPLAAGLMGAMVGDIVDFDGALPPVEVVAIEPGDR